MIFMTTLLLFITAVKGEELTIVAHHDEYSLWFDLVHPAREEETPRADPAGCHLLLPMSRLRLGEVNSAERNTIYAAVLRGILATSQAPAQQWVLALGDQSLLGLMAAKLLGGVRVVVSTSNQHMQQVIQRLAEENNVSVEICPDLDRLRPEEQEGRLAAIIGDPFYTVSILPWHNLLFWYSAQQVLQKLLGIIKRLGMPSVACFLTPPITHKIMLEFRKPSYILLRLSNTIAHKSYRRAAKPFWVGTVEGFSRSRTGAPAHDLNLQMTTGI